MTHKHIRYRFRFTKEMLRLPSSIKLLSFVIFVYYLGWGIVTPYFPLYLKTLFKDYTTIGLITGMLPLIAIFTYLILGPLIDRISKKKVITLSLLLYAPFSIILLGMSTVLQFFYFRIYHAIIASSLWISSDSYLREHAPKNRKSESIGLFDSFYTLSLVIGPIIGAFLIIRYSFNILYAISIFAFLAFLFSFLLHDKKGMSLSKGLKAVFVKDHFIKKELSDFWSNKMLVKFSLFMFLFYFATSFIGLVIPLILQSFGTDLFKIGLLSALFNLPLISESYFSTLKKKKTSVIFGLLFAAALSLLMFMSKDVFIFGILIFLLGLSIVAVIPIIQGRLTELMPKKEIGELVGVNSSIWNIASGFGPIVGGIIADKLGLNYTFLLAFIIFSVLLLIAVLSKSFYFKEEKIIDGVAKV